MSKVFQLIMALLDDWFTFIVFELWDIEALPDFTIPSVGKAVEDIPWALAKLKDWIAITYK